MKVGVPFRHRLHLMDACVDCLAALLDHPPHIVVRDAKIVGIVRLGADPREKLGVLWIVPCFRRNNILAGIGRATPSKTENSHLWLLSKYHDATEHDRRFPPVKAGTQLPPCG